MVIGMFLDEPPPGSIASTCDLCEDPIIVGPDSQQVMKLRPDTVKVCADCALRGMAAAAEAGELDLQFGRARNMPGVTASYVDPPSRGVDLAIVSDKPTPYFTFCAWAECAQKLYLPEPIPKGKMAFCSPQHMHLHDAARRGRPQPS